MRPSQSVGDWLTLLGLFAIGLLIDAIMALLGLFIFELLGVWPIGEHTGSGAGRAIPSPHVATRWVG